MRGIIIDTALFFYNKKIPLSEVTEQRDFRLILEYPPEIVIYPTQGLITSIIIANRLLFRKESIF